MKKYFITGLIILLPATLTLVVLGFLFNLLTDPFLDLTRTLFQHYIPMHKGFLLFTQEQIINGISKILIFIVLIGITILLGAVAHWFFIHSLIQLWDYIIHRIPFVGAVYKACKDVVRTIFGSKTTAFKQVVMVPFPNENTLTIGLVTRESFPSFDETAERCMVVFVPTTPNPTSGFLVIVKEKDLIHLDMSVEEAFKYVISCGVIMSPFKKAALKEMRMKNA